MAGSIGERIAVLKQELGISSNRELEKGGLSGDEWIVSNGLIAKWEASDPEHFSTSVVERFLNHYKVNRDWWKTGKGEVFLKNGTYVELPKGSPENEEVYRNIVEGNTEYILIPRSVLQEKYRLVALEQFEKDKEQMDKDKKIIDRLLSINEKLMNAMASLEPKATEVQKAQ